jgi:hypothetical protein
LVAFVALVALTFTGKVVDVSLSAVYVPPAEGMVPSVKVRLSAVLSSVPPTRIAKYTDVMVQAVGTSVPGPVVTADVPA